jgi:sulfur carrier protein
MNAAELIIRLNGVPEPLTATTVAALVAAKTIEGERGIAVALNGSVVPRAAWDETSLHPGDEIEIVRARQGG